MVLGLDRAPAPNRGGIHGVPGRNAKRGLDHAWVDLVADPVRARSLEQHFEETIKRGTGKQHHPDAQASPGIHAPIDRGHEEDVEDLISKHRDDGHDAPQPAPQALQKGVHG